MLWASGFGAYGQQVWAAVPSVQAEPSNQAEQMLLSEYLHTYGERNQVNIAYEASVVKGIKIRVSPKGDVYSNRKLEQVLRDNHLRIDQISKTEFIVVPANWPIYSGSPGSVGATMGSTQGPETLSAAVPRPPDAKWVITGRVKDAQGNGLPGVNIYIKTSPAIGVSTNVDGIFSLTLPNDLQAPVLVFSMMGYVSQEIAIAEGQTVVNAVLAEDVMLADEVVVVGYGQVRKEDLTGSVAPINVKEIKDLPVASIGDAMQGRAAGLQVISQGAPGNDPIFLVRGVGTLNSTTPLFVIDGVPVMSGLQNLNPEDIESIQVLKDASASAIYGARGANGVIIITTKRGKGQKTGFSISGYTGLQQATSIIPMLNAGQFANLHNEMLTNAGNGNLNPAFANPASLGRGTNWLTEMLRPAPMQSITAAYSVSTDKSNYYVSGSVLNQQGIVLNTAYRRYTLQFNADNQVTNWLKFGNNVTLNHDEKPSGAYSLLDAMRSLPTLSVLDSAGNYNGPRNGLWEGDIRNPIATANLIRNTVDGYNIIGNLYAEAALLPNLRLRSTIGLQDNFWFTRTWAPAYDYKPIAQPMSSLSEGGNRSLTTLWDNILTYDLRPSADHHIMMVAGTSAQSNTFKNLFASGQDFVSDQAQLLSNANPKYWTAGSSFSDWAIFSIFARANYDYKGRYLFTGTIRRDGSSRFGPRQRYGIFPSGSVAWRLTEEAFLKNSDIFSEVKLRAGWGMTGNQEIGNYPFANVLPTSSYNFNNTLVSSVVPFSMPNPFIRWESTSQTNIGADVSLLKNRIAITADAYLRVTNGMIMPKATPISTGYNESGTLVNTGGMENKGVELSISTHNLTGALSWKTSFNFSANQNNVTSLADTAPVISGNIGLNYSLTRTVVGQPVNSLYGFVTDGIFQSQDEVNNHARQVVGTGPANGTAPGDVKFRDLNGDNIINDKDRTFIGNPNPRFIYALNNAFTYKGFDLSLFVQGVQGNQIFNANRISTEGMKVIYNQTIATLNRWVGPGTSNSMPRAIYGDPNNNTRPSDRFIEDGSYLRIKNVTLGYSLPANLLKKVHIGTTRFYASAQNLLTFTRYTGFDPEISGYTGIDLGTYPVTRTYVFGLNISI